MKTICDIGEDQLIERFRRRYKQTKRTIVGIGDDAAVVRVSKDKFLVLTSDMLVEGIHFLKGEASPYQIGWKAMGSALSDIAAMAAVPRTAIVSLGLSPRTPVSFVEGLTKGIEALARCFNIDVVGGDTVNFPRGIVISVSVVGEAERKNLVLRKGASIGDKILVTGSLGGSRKRKQYRFIPRIKEALRLVKCIPIHSMMDITDGLGLDLFRLVSASGVGAKLYKESIPVSSDAKGVGNALADGEDFELIFVTSTDSAKKLLEKWKNEDVPVTVIGEIIKEKGRVELIDKYGKAKKLKPKGYEHFVK